MTKSAFNTYRKNIDINNPKLYIKRETLTYEFFNALPDGKVISVIEMYNIAKQAGITARPSTMIANLVRLGLLIPVDKVKSQRVQLNSAEMRRAVDMLNGTDKDVCGNAQVQENPERAMAATGGIGDASDYDLLDELRKRGFSWHGMTKRVKYEYSYRFNPDTNRFEATEKKYDLQ